MLPWDLAPGLLLRVCVQDQKAEVSHVSLGLVVMFTFLSILSACSWKQHRDVLAPTENTVSKGSLYARTTDYIEGESPHLPKELDHSLGIAREEVP